MKIIKLFIHPDKFDLISGYASVWPIEGVWEQEGHIDLYVEDDQVSLIEEELSRLPKDLSPRYEISAMPAVNWNEAWEANFDPVQVGDFCLIYAPFHTDLPDCTYTIELMPKMAFGTGHHETTYMMIEHMSDLDFHGKTVLDFGCGTSVLAILAEKMGASEILAVDHESPAVENSEENISINNAHHIKVIQGQLKDILPRPFDIILANINFGVLIATAEELKSYVGINSRLLLSGILVDKKDEIKTMYQSKGWRILKEKEMGEWTSFLLELG